tara:strand:+ start:560 stop:808 length:249 start_codon:yes stop_codon:yes gene_type:complete
MATTSYFEEDLYPPNDDGRADKSKPSNTLEVIVSNFHGDHQIYLKITDESGEGKTLHLSKEQAKSLSDGCESADLYIGYDNK